METEEKKTSGIVNKTYTDPVTGKFIPGNPGGGRPKDTEDDKLRKEALKKIIESYEQKLTEILPDIPEVMRVEAKKGNMVAIKEINDRVLGKPLQRMANADGSNLKIEFNHIFNDKVSEPPSEASGDN